MAVTIWQPGTLYQPGSLVIPQTAPPIVTGELDNPTFEDGDTGWAKGTGWDIVMGTGYDGVWVGRYPVGVIGQAYIINDTEVAVTPGQSITAQCYINTTGNNPAQGGASLKIFWYDASHVLISASDSALFSSGGDNWRQATVTGFAPASAAFAKIAGNAYRNSGPHNIYFDSFSWDYVSSPIPDGLMFKAVQADAGFSGNLEPTWPTTLGNTVVDNQVTWEAVLTTRVTWEATPIMISGSMEPTFPTVVGSSVADNTISWVAISRRVEDSKCPNTIPVAIAASKVFAGDEDIVAFSATVNPLDWSTADDAGYLPFGLQTYGSQPVSAMGLYRGNLVVFNATGFQMWQVDQDPANMTLLDSVPISCTYPRSVQGVSNDLFFLTPKGVRGIGIAGASTNLQANGVGEPIDPLVSAAVRAGTYDPISLYWPFTGQYWVIFGAEAFVLTINGTNKRSWSRYEFPKVITDWTLDGDDLVLRATGGDYDFVWRMDPTATADNIANLSAYTAGEGSGFVGYDPFHSVGSVVSTDLTDHTILFAAYNNVADRFELWVSNIFNEFDDIESIRIYDSSDPTAMRLLVEYNVGDAATNNVGNVVLDSVTYPGVAVYTWDDEVNYLDHVATFTVEIVGMDDDCFEEEFQGTLWWPYLDLGVPGREKQFIGLDAVAEAPEGMTVSVGYDQRDRSARTVAYTIDADTLPGQLIPIPVSGPSFDLKIVFEPNQIWEFNAATLYVRDWRPTS